MTSRFNDWVPLHEPAGRLLVVAALRTEYLALCGHGLSLARCGLGERRARRWAQRQSGTGVEHLVLVGVSGGLELDLRATDVVVASSVLDGRTSTALPPADDLAAALVRAGLHVQTGAIATSQQLLMGRPQRAALHAAGALCVDMESAGIVQGWAGRSPVTIVRVVVDTPHAGLLHPATIPNGVRALVTIRRVARVLSGRGAAPGRRSR